jgi:hypothetical protein
MKLSKILYQPHETSHGRPSGEYGDVAVETQALEVQALSRRGRYSVAGHGAVARLA